MLDTKTKNIIIVSAVIGVVSIIYLSLSKGKSKKNDKNNGKNGGGLLNNKLTLTTGTCIYGKVGIIESDRKPSNDDFIKEGAEFEVKGTNFDGKYKVETIYRDDNGNIDYVSSNFPTNACLINKEYSGKGKILFKK